MDMNGKFGAILKNLRKEKGLSQEQLGEVLKVHKATVSKWEKGRIPDAEMLNIIAEHFGVKVDYLLGNEEENGLAQAIKRVKSDISHQSSKASILINTLIETGLINQNGEASEEVWAVIRAAIKEHAKEVYNKKGEANE